MRCRTMQERLALYMDRALDLEEHHRVKAHLSNCPTCASQVEGLEAPPPPLPPLPESMRETFAMDMGRSLELRLEGLGRRVQPIPIIPRHTTLRPVVAWAAGVLVGIMGALVFPNGVDRVPLDLDVHSMITVGDTRSEAGGGNTSTFKLGPEGVPGSGQDTWTAKTPTEQLTISYERFKELTLVWTAMGHSDPEDTVVKSPKPTLSPTAFLLARSSATHPFPVP